MVTRLHLESFDRICEAVETSGDHNSPAGDIKSSFGDVVPLSQHDIGGCIVDLYKHINEVIRRSADTDRSGNDSQPVVKGFLCPKARITGVARVLGILDVELAIGGVDFFYAARFQNHSQLPGNQRL